MAENGEERLLTLFGDVHYYFSEPIPHPVHHRFDKESYIYLYRDSANRRGRLEIANHAGTKDQDAFTGYMNASKIVQSHRHPTLVTVIVDGIKTSEPPPTSDHHWRLPSTDPRDEGKYLFRLHTIDLYFWTVEDARFFVYNAQQTLQSNQFDIDVPPMSAPHTDSMSPVVQKLESAAISDPAYHTQHRDSQASQSGSQVPPPPAGGPPPGSRQPEDRSREQPADTTPMAYNPAAPAAPEVHKHREKTPPPPEAGQDGTGLASAAYRDQAPPPGPGIQYNNPQRQSSMSSHTSPPPPQTFTPGSHSHRGSTTSPSSAAQRYTPHNQDPNAQFMPQSQPQQTPTQEIVGDPLSGGGHRPSLAHVQPQYPDYLAQQQQQHQQAKPPQQQQQAPQQPAPPVGGYANYSYDQQAQAQYAAGHQNYYQQNPYSTGDQSIHTQVYRPTEEEASHGVKPGRASTTGPAGKWDQRYDKVEKGAGKWFKKLEKKIG